MFCGRCPFFQRTDGVYYCTHPRPVLLLNERLRQEGQPSQGEYQTETQKMQLTRIPIGLPNSSDRGGRLLQVLDPTPVSSLQENQTDKPLNTVTSGYTVAV